MIVHGVGQWRHHKNGTGKEVDLGKTFVVASETPADGSGLTGTAAPPPPPARADKGSEKKRWQHVHQRVHEAVLSQDTEPLQPTNQLTLAEALDLEEGALFRMEGAISSSSSSSSRMSRRSR